MRGALRAAGAARRWSLPVLAAVLQVSAAFWAPAPAPPLQTGARAPALAALRLRMQGGTPGGQPDAGAAEHMLLLRLRRRALYAAGCAASAGLLLPPRAPCWADVAAQRADGQVRGRCGRSRGCGCVAVALRRLDRLARCEMRCCGQTLSLYRCGVPEPETGRGGPAAGGGLFLNSRLCACGACGACGAVCPHSGS